MRFPARLLAPFIVVAVLIVSSPEAGAVLAQCPTQLRTMQTEADATIKDLRERRQRGELSLEAWNKQRAWQVCLKNVFYNALRDTPRKQCDATLQQYRALSKEPKPLSFKFGTCTP